MSHFFWCLALCLGFSSFLQAQNEPTKLLRPGEYYGTTKVNGQIIKILVIDGDTLPVIDLDQVQISNKREFKNRDERRRYNQWRRYAAKVYPYAAEAIKLYREIERDTKGMTKKQRKRYTKAKQKELSPKYEEELKKLTKTQGYILIKMVERELQQPFYEVIGELRGGWEAIKWQGMGSMYGYDLRAGYNPKDDELLEMILEDLNISYELP